MKTSSRSRRPSIVKVLRALAVFASCASVACGTQATAGSGAGESAAGDDPRIVRNGSGAPTTCTRDVDCPAGAHCVATGIGEFGSGTCTSDSLSPPRDGSSETSSETDEAAEDAGALTSNVFQSGAPDASPPPSPSPTPVPSTPPPAPVTPTCGEPIFGPDSASAPGGVRAFDSQGAIYYTTYWGSLARVAAGGGTREVIYTRADVGSYGLLGTPFVLDDDTVLFGAANSIRRYVPATGTNTIFAATGTNGFGWGILRDATGRVLACASAPSLFSPSGQPQPKNLEGTFLLVRDGWAYRRSNDAIEKVCADGTNTLSSTYANVHDNYGLAFGPDGTIYTGQGNTFPSTVYAIPPGGGSAVPIATLPGAVTFVATDAAGYVYVAGWGSSTLDTLWRIDPKTQTKRVYGCDPRTAFPCTP
jgi:hypothetical protein